MWAQARARGAWRQEGVPLRALAPHARPARSPRARLRQPRAMLQPSGPQAGSGGALSRWRAVAAAPPRPVARSVRRGGRDGRRVVGGVEPAEAAVDDAVAGHRPSAADVGAHFDPDPVLVHRPPSPGSAARSAGLEGRWPGRVADRGPPDDSRADRGVGHIRRWRTAMRAPSRPAAASTPATVSSETARVAPWARKPIKAGPASTPA